MRLVPACSTAARTSLRPPMLHTGLRQWVGRAVTSIPLRRMIGPPRVLAGVAVAETRLRLAPSASSWLVSKLPR